MLELEIVNDDNFQEFLASPVVFLLLGREDCEACVSWISTLQNSNLKLSNIRAGKLILGTGKLTNFRRVHGSWSSHIRELPHNSIWMNGSMVKEWLGGGDLDRLMNRLEGLQLLDTWID